MKTQTQTQTQTVIQVRDPRSTGLATTVASTLPTLAKEARKYIGSKRRMDTAHTVCSRCGGNKSRRSMRCRACYMVLSALALQQLMAERKKRGLPAKHYSRMEITEAIANSDDSQRWLRNIKMQQEVDRSSAGSNRPLNRKTIGEGVRPEQLKLKRRELCPECYKFHDGECDERGGN